MFILLDPEASGFDFTNEVVNQKNFNIFKYRNFYNGGGVAIGDINNDGLSDIYMTANMGKNKLFRNEGNMKFEDISEQAGIEGNKPWSTGVVMIDINNDGFLDIYVSNAGNLEGNNHDNDLWKDESMWKGEIYRDEFMPYQTGDSTKSEPHFAVIPSSFNVNGNEIADYEEDFLLFNPDRYFFARLLFDDENFNGIKEYEENDIDPDYTFDRNRAGFKGIYEIEPLKVGTFSVGALYNRKVSSSDIK